MRRGPTPRPELRRAKVLQVQVTAQEFEAIKNKAFDAGLSVSTYLRQTIVQATNLRGDK
jgi:predicted DNA binding CopG/RHH family protein